jgi:hypothetical protein
MCFLNICRILQRAIKSLVLFGNLEEVWNGLESDAEVKTKITIFNKKNMYMSRPD